MKLLTLSLLLLAVDLDAKPNFLLPILLPSSQYHSQDTLGQYSYGYSNPQSAKAEMKTADGITKGSYSYVDADGKLQSVHYTSDAINGFRAVATNLPAPVVPLAVPTIIQHGTIKTGISPQPSEEPQENQEQLIQDDNDQGDSDGPRGKPLPLPTLRTQPIQTHTTTIHQIHSLPLFKTSYSTVQYDALSSSYFVSIPPGCPNYVRVLWDPYLQPVLSYQAPQLQQLATEAPAARRQERSQHTIQTHTVYHAPSSSYATLTYDAPSSSYLVSIPPGCPDSVRVLWNPYAYTALNYQAPKLPEAPTETPEVAKARAEHIKAHEEAKARNS